MKDLIDNAAKQPGATFNYAQCRSDTRKWTTDPFDKDDPRNLSVGLSLLVNGQFRGMPVVTRHLPISQLLDRIYEMSVCERTDPDFQKQSNTYALMGKQYEAEESLRYQMYILTHNLNDQFLKEDAEDNK